MLSVATISRLANLLELQSKVLSEDGLANEARDALAEARRLKLLVEIDGA